MCKHDPVEEVMIKHFDPDLPYLKNYMVRKSQHLVKHNAFLSPKKENNQSVCTICMKIQMVCL